MHLYQGFIRSRSSEVSQSQAGSVSLFNIMPDPAVALSVCTEAALSNTRILDDIACQFSKHTQADLRDDVPALIRAAVMTGIMIITVRIRRQALVPSDTPFLPGGNDRSYVAHDDKLKEYSNDSFGISEEDGRLYVCMAYLKCVQDGYVLPSIYVINLP